MKLLQKSQIAVILVINMSCSFSQRYVDPRTFFMSTKADYYNKTLDSFGIIGHFGLDSLGIIVNDNRYWELKNTLSNFFTLKGMLRSQGDTIFILTQDSRKDRKSGYCEEQVLFICNEIAINKSWAVDYSCNAPMVNGDSILLSRIDFDKDLNDTLYTFNLKSFLKSTRDNINMNFTTNRTKITLSKKIGFIQFTFISTYNKTCLNIYPKFERLDSNSLKPEY